MAPGTAEAAALLIPGIGNCNEAICSMCNVKNVGQLEILLHKISTLHLKKWRSDIRLQGQCMACSVSLSDIKAAEAHVQGSGHEHRMIHDFKLGSFADWIYKCPPCGIAFHCSIALELHLVMTHKVAFSTENLPDVVNVIQLLSGSSTDASKGNINLKCSVCQMNYEAMDDFVVHLFSNTHVQSLRTSACIICEKKFIHVRDREEHLRASRHRFRVQKSCLNNKLRKVKDIGQLEHAGYLCMYCMVWCKSWPCFMLHLLDNSHSSYAGKQDQQHMNQIARNMSKLSNGEAIEDTPYPSTSSRNWKRWLDQPVGLSAWCHVCEEIFPSPEATEKHLEDHHHLQNMHARKRYCRLNSISDTGEKSSCFECEVCCVIFKSAFALTVHKAFRQHHIQQSHMSRDSISCGCFDCRMQRRSTVLEKSKMPKLNSAEISHLHQEMANAENHLTKVSESETKQESAGKSSNLDEFEGTRENNCELSDSISKEDGIPFEVEVDKGKMVSKTLDTVCVNNSSTDHVSFADSDPLEAGGKAARDANFGTTKQHLRESSIRCQNKDGPDCCEPIESGILLGSKEMIPVVIAAALPPSESIQNSLQSAMKLVTDSLFAALPKIRKPFTELCSVRKRPKCEMHNDHANKSEGGNLGAILEAAVCEGLQSLHSHSGPSAAPVSRGRPEPNPEQDQKLRCSTCGVANGSGLPPMSISMDNAQGISVVLAAAVIPQASSTEAPLLTCPLSDNEMPFSTDPGDNSHEMDTQKICEREQKIDGARTELNETDAVQDKDKASPVGERSEQDITRRLNIAYEEDSSSDGNDGKGYLSHDDSESSEDEY